MPTKLIRSLYNIPPNLRGGVLTIGNFDGVHCGHQQLIKKVTAAARALQAPALVITFEPHPFEFFAGGEQQTPRITRLREKFSALRALGVDGVMILPFKQALANMSASDFAAMLKQDLDPKQIIIGDDFRYGKKRQGNFEMLKASGAAANYRVEAMPSYVLDGERTSSTLVRAALVAGDLKRAAHLLGRPYTMMGRVCQGDQLGRQLGFPTANIFLHRRLSPLQGIFIVKMHGVSSQPLPGVANLGIRPTVDGTRTLLEVHLLDFDQDIYGKYVEVEFIKKVRDEERYDNLEILAEKIGEDVQVGRDYFKQEKQ